MFMSLTLIGTDISSAMLFGKTTWSELRLPSPDITVLVDLKTRILFIDYLNKPYLVIAAENNEHGSLTFCLLDINFNI